MKNEHAIGSTPERPRGRRLTRRELVRAGVAAGSGLAGAWLLEGSGPQLLGSAAYAAAAPKRGGTITWGMTSDPVNYAPFGGVAGSSFEVTSLVYESLLAWDKNLKILPALATSFQIPDNKTYIFKLRQGVKFHNGQELTSDDVKYSLELQKTPPPPGVIQGFYPKIVGVDATDKYTVTIHMGEPDATLLGYLAWGRYSWIVPKGLYDQMDVRTKAVGTGPFKLTEFIPNDHSTFVRNQDYWNKSLPYLDGITMKVMQDEQARVAALRTGAIDGSTFTSDTTKTMANDSNLTVLKGLQASFREMELTIHGDGKPWNNVKVRQAVSAAINRQEIIDKVYGGDALFTSKIPIGYGDWPIPQDALHKTYEVFDVNKAKQLMAEAGVANGFSVTLQSIAHPTDYTESAQVIKQQLAAININVTVQPLEIGTFAANNGNGSFEWQNTGRGMRGDPSGYIADFDPTSAVDKAWYGGGYNNQELNNLYFQGIHETNPVKRLPLYRRMQEIVITEWPAIPLVNPMVYQVVRKRLNGYYVSFVGNEVALLQSWVS